MRSDGSSTKTLLDVAVRRADPTLHLQGRWILRRPAPDCSRIDLTSLPKERDESRLLHAMGRETANIHLGSRKQVKKIERDLRQRPVAWLHHGSAAMVQELKTDCVTGSGTCGSHRRRGRSCLGLPPRPCGLNTRPIIKLINPCSRSARCSPPE